MAQVQLSLDHDFAAAPQVVWDALVDWKGHEQWIPATRVELHGPGDPTAVGAEFTAWSGIGRRLALEDRMRVDLFEFDPSTSSGTCRVTKLGPLLGGWAEFIVAPAAGGTVVTWIEDVTIPYLPQFLAPVGKVIGVFGFKFGLSRLAHMLRDVRAVAV